MKSAVRVVYLHPFIKIIDQNIFHLKYHEQHLCKIVTGLFPIIYMLDVSCKGWKQDY